VGNNPKAAYHPPYALITLSVAVFFWLFDSLVHLLFYGEAEFEFIPTEFNELWMRTTIFLLIIAMGIYAELSVKRLMRAEEEKFQLEKRLNESLHNELKLQQQQIEITKETVLNMQNIINNFLNNLLLFQNEAKEKNALSDDSLEQLDRMVQETAASIQQLGEKAIDKASTGPEGRPN